MRKKTHVSSRDWLPVESWLIPSFHFTHVHGIARVFLIAEIVLSVCVVFGVFLLAFFNALS